MANTYVEGYHIPMPRIVPCEWVECNCPGWHVVQAGDGGDLAVRVPVLFKLSHSRLGCKVVDSKFGPKSLRVANWFGKVLDTIDNAVREYTQYRMFDPSVPWWWRFVPQSWVVNCHCNGGGSLTQAVANMLEPGWVAAYWGDEDAADCCMRCGLAHGHGRVPIEGGSWVDPR